MKLEDRFHHLEQQNSRLKLALFSMGIVLFGVGVVLIFTLHFVLESRTYMIDEIRAKEDASSMVQGNTTGLQETTPSLHKEPEIVQIKRFEVVGDDGEVVASLGSNKIGDGLVMTYNKRADGYVQLHAIVNRGGEVTIYESKGQELVFWGINEEIHGAISITSGESMGLVSGTQFHDISLEPKTE